MAKVFKVERLVRHGHTDPAGIVYYPRYFEMINDTIEDLFLAIDRPFAAMHLQEKKGLPTVKVETNFLKPSHCGDVLEFSVTVENLGGSSVEFELIVRCHNEVRLRANLTSVFVDMTTMRSIEFDDQLRFSLEKYKRPSEG